MKAIQTICLMSSFFFTTQASAWVYSDQVTINYIVQWEGESPTYLHLSNGTSCYVPFNDKHNYNLVMLAFASTKTINIHCHDSSESNGGISGHRLHRLIVNK